MRRNFIPRNEGFTCERCGTAVPPAQGTFRNHCPVCLTAKHVDRNVPGDRLSSCGGLMPTVSIEGTDPARLDLVQQCEQCSHRQTNRAASDDDYQAILTVIEELDKIG